MKVEERIKVEQAMKFELGIEVAQLIKFKSEWMLNNE